MLSNVSLIRRIKLKNFSTNAKTKHFCLCAHKISFKQFTTNQPIRIHCNESEKISIYFFLYFVLNESLYFDEFNYIERQKPNYFTLNEKNKYGYCTWTRFICNSGTHFDLQVNKKSANILLKIDSSWIDCISHEFTFNWTKASRIAFDIEYTNCSRSTGVKLWYCPLLQYDVI